MKSSGKGYFEAAYGLTRAEADRIAQRIREHIAEDVASGRYIELASLPDQQPTNSVTQSIPDHG